MPVGRRGLNQDVFEDRVTALEDPVYQADLLRLHMMMSHRGISLDEISAEVGRDKHWSRLVYYGRVDRFSIARRRAAVEEFETAITAITDRRGGIPSACCSEKALEAMTQVLSRAPYEEVMA